MGNDYNSNGTINPVNSGNLNNINNMTPNNYTPQTGDRLRMAANNIFK
jgi:hypothetical protein